MAPERTHQQIPSPERDTTFRIPFLAVQEVLGIVEDPFLDSSIENDRTQRALGAGCDQPPLILGVGCMYRDEFFLCGFPGILCFEQQLVDDLVITSKDPSIPESTPSTDEVTGG